MKLLRPELPYELVATDDMASLIDQDESIKEAEIVDADAVGVLAKALAIDSSHIVRTDISQAKISGFSLSNSLIEDSTLIASQFANASWHVVEVKNSRCSGLQLHESLLKNVVFKNCKLDLTNFRFSSLTNVLFDSCVVTEMDFYNATLKDVSLVNCEIENVEFTGAKMKNVDLTESSIISFRGFSSLKGMSINNEQLISLAPYFAQELGITVTES